MKTEYAGLWLKCSSLSRFFAGLDIWYEKEQLIPVLEGIQAGLSKDPLIRQEYDDLFCGTNADVYVPLWASVCVKENGCLLDETTLEIIKLYKKFGYKAVDMNGNPPDYIGQLLRFAAYLTACISHSIFVGNDSSEEEAVLNDLLSKYIADTVDAVAKAIESQSSTGFFLSVANALRALPGESFKARLNVEDVSAALECLDSYRSGRSEEIPVGKARDVITAGRNNCGGRCSIRATEQEGCLLNITSSCAIGDPELRMCVRGRAYRKTYMSGQRLRYPMIRIGRRGEGRFRRVSWEGAVSFIAQESKRIKEMYGPGSRFVVYSTGSQGVMRPDHLAKRLLNCDGGRLDYYGTYSNHCTNYVTPYIYGDFFSGNSVEDLLNTKLLILWANNPSESIQGSQRAYYTALAKEKGMKIIVIDPRQSDSALAIADEWIGIRPSTDGALADSMAYVILSEKLEDRHFMDTYCIGFDEDHMPEGVPKELNYTNYLFGGLDGIIKDPSWGESITGVPAETIIKLAREYATTKPACLLPGLGNQRTGNGEQTVRGMAALTCLTGNIGIPGGSAAGAGIAMEEPGPRLPLGDNAYPGIISCFLWPRAVEDGPSMTQKDDHIQGMERLGSSIKMIFNLAGNCLINQHSNINDSKRILEDTEKCELIVSSDVFMTASARFADVLLPAPSFLEDDDIVGANITGHYLLCCNKVVEPLFGCRTEYQWMSELSKELGIYEAFTEGRKTQEDWLKYLFEDLKTKNSRLPDYEIFRKNGGCTYHDAPCYIAYEKQIRDPEHYKFSTPSGKIEICSKRLYDFNDPDRIPAIPSYTPCPEGPDDPLKKKYPLQLIGWHTKWRCHSIHGNNKMLEEVEPHRLWMHPDDAAIRNISDGDTVKVFNARGEIEIKAKITERIIKGVVAMPQGAWYKPGKDGIDRGGCINSLTSSEPTPLSKGNPQHSNLVEVCIG